MFLGFQLSEFLPFPKHVSWGEVIYGDQVCDFRVLKNGNIRFQRFPSSHRRKVKQSICCHLPHRDLKKEKNLESVIVTQENMQNPKAYNASLTQILRLTIKFTDI